VDNSYKYYENKGCMFFPCHPGLYKNKGLHNCLFCYCPLFFIDDCGGNFINIDRPDGTVMKDCSPCTKNHGENSHEFVVRKLSGGEYFNIEGNIDKNGKINKPKK